MNRLSLLLFGIFLTFASAWVGLVMVPYFQLGNLKPEVDEITGEMAPPSMSGLADAGRKVYAANGCIYCHSQQLRPETFGSDIKRGWGVRRTVARDYIGEKPVMLGTMRTGPDLSNIGRRQTSAEWHHLHLYEPEAVVPGSLMPPYRFLYKKRPIAGEPSEDALEIDGIEPGYEVVPTREAKALVAYLLSLDKAYSLPEAPTE